MKYNGFIFWILSSRLQKYLSEDYPAEDVKEWVRKAKPVYKKLLSEVEGISDKDPMGSNITTSFVVIAVWLASDRKITPEKMSKAFRKTVNMGIVRGMAGMIDLNTEKGIAAFGKMMKKNTAFADAHPEYPNTWKTVYDDGHELHKDGFYYHFTYCPIAAFCKEHGYEEINPVLCDIDYTTMTMMHAVLLREHTIAEGGEICDYWMVGDKVKDPQ